MSTFPTIDLKTASDEAINAAVAEHCAGYSWFVSIYDGGRFLGKATTLVKQVVATDEHPLSKAAFDQTPDYSHNANAVIELLEKANFAVEINFDPTCDTWHVLLMGRFNSEYSVRSGPQETFCKAAAIALLKASGKIEVIE